MPGAGSRSVNAHSPAGGRLKCGQVMMGTCGWSSNDAPWAKPPTGATAAEKLRMYSGPGIGFGCVEVDTSTYQIVDPAHVAKWCAATPPGFVFCFKMFGFVCAKGGQLGGQFPRDIQDKLPGPLAQAPKGTRVDLHQIPDAVIDEIWDRFHQSIEPARAAGKLGPVLFQFHLGFVPGDSSRAHVEWCRARLDAHIRMAVDFRDRAWVEGPQLGATVRWLRTLDIALAASDDLQHELTGDASSGDRVRLPIVARVATPQFAFARVHRRAGCERLLDGNEIAQWASLLRRMRKGETGEDERSSWIGDEPDPALTGPIFFFWGTDHKDQCVKNAAALQEALGEQNFDWKTYLKELQANVKGGLAGFLAKGRLQQDAQSTMATNSRRSQMSARGTGKLASLDSDNEKISGCVESRVRRTTDVCSQYLRSTADAVAVGSDTGTAPTGRATVATPDVREAARRSSGLSDGSRSGNGATGSSSSSTMISSTVQRIVPPAREAAFLKSQERARECDRVVDPVVFRTLPREIRAELVTAWWDARPDVVAARKWASEMAAKQRLRRQHNCEYKDHTSSSGSDSRIKRKRGRRGSDVGVTASGQVRSIKDFLS